MQIELISTNNIVDVNGVEARLWEGYTKTGIKIHALITRIAVASDDPRADELKQELEERCPIKEAYVYPLRIII